MKQDPLPGMDVPPKVVNIASVPHRSPFRYPGGKTWLVPTTRQWLDAVQPERLVEPFAGGAIVGLSAVFERRVKHLVLVEKDEQVAAVWTCVIEDGDGPWLAEQITRLDLTPDTVDKILETPGSNTREMALQTIVKNRVNRGGILAEGAGRVKNGENGKGITSRWYPNTLSKRILAIHALRDRITFVQGDGLRTVADHERDPRTAFFVDPPYTVAGKSAGSRLYNHSEIDHDLLFRTLARCHGDFLMTYDNNDDVAAMALAHGLQTQPVAMKNTHHARLTELLIGRDLSWMA